MAHTKHVSLYVSQVSPNIVIEIIIYNSGQSRRRLVLITHGSGIFYTVNVWREYDMTQIAYYDCDILICKNYMKMYS